MSFFFWYQLKLKCEIFIKKVMRSGRLQTTSVSSDHITLYSTFSWSCTFVAVHLVVSIYMIWSHCFHCLINSTQFHFQHGSNRFRDTLFCFNIITDPCSLGDKENIPKFDVAEKQTGLQKVLTSTASKTFRINWNLVSQTLWLKISGWPY